MGKKLMFFGVFNFRNYWPVGEPKKQGVEYCKIFSENGWNALPCSHEAFWICKKPALPCPKWILFPSMVSIQGSSSSSWILVHFVFLWHLGLKIPSEFYISRHLVFTHSVHSCVLSWVNNLHRLGSGFCHVLSFLPGLNSGLLITPLTCCSHSSSWVWKEEWPAILLHLLSCCYFLQLLLCLHQHQELHLFGIISQNKQFHPYAAFCLVILSK